MSSVLFLIEVSFLLQSLLRDNFYLCSDLPATSTRNEAAFDFVFVSGIIFKFSQTERIRDQVGYTKPHLHRVYTNS